MKNFLAEKIGKSLEVLKEQMYENKTQLETVLYQAGTDTIEQANRLQWRETALPFYTKTDGSYCAFRFSVPVEGALLGKTVEVFLTTGREGEWDATNPQFAAYLDGAVLQGVDINHRTIRLPKTEAPKTFEITLVGFVGSVPGDLILTVGYGAVCEPVYELYYDLKTPYDVLKMFGEEDANRAVIEHHLNEAINRIDFRYPMSEAFLKSVAAAKAYMDKFYDEVCGSDDDQPVVYAVGHTHIDVAWLWPLKRTREKSICSFSTAENLMERYPDYIFMSSQPQLYEFVKQQDPALYEKIKEKIKAGQWEAEGAMWLEADCNLTSGESLVRQILFGKRFFREEFGVDNKILWLPDVFGYSAALPQILQKCEVPYFMTSKISWNDTNKVPNDTFLWEGIDGSQVLTFFLTTCDYPLVPGNHTTTYVGHATPKEIKGTWERYQNKRINNATMTLYGHGDGGGGTTPEMIETLKRLEKGIPGCPKVKFASGTAFFKKLAENVEGSKYLPKWVGELYLEMHRGTYTTMNKTKKYNRKSEILYQDTELFSVLSQVLAGKPYEQETINRGWKTILLNQFHDILPGSSIKQVYDESYAQYAQITDAANKVMQDSFRMIADKVKTDKKAVVCFNDLSFERSDVVCLAGDIGVAGARCQKTADGNTLALVENVPPKGYIALPTASYEEGEPVSRIDGNRIETPYYRIGLDENGNVASLYDKAFDRQIIKDGGKTMLEIYEDMPYLYDNWDISPYYEQKMWELDKSDSVKVIENGAVRTVIRVEKTYYNSKICYDIMLYAHTRRIDFAFAIDWKESDVLLKFKVPTTVYANKATYEIQYGSCERPTHRNTSWDAAKYEVCAHKWADLSESGYGVSMLNDCKYGHQIIDGDLRWTLNKCTSYPNPEAGRDQQTFVLSVLPHGGSVSTETIKEGYLLNTPLYTALTDAHDGALPTNFSLASVDNDAVIIEVIKKAEDEDAYVLRLYEATGGCAKTTLTLSMGKSDIYTCNMLEKKAEKLASGNRISLTFKPFEIKTLLVK